LLKCSSRARTSWRTSKAKSAPTLGTSNRYVAFTLRKDFQVFFHIPDTPVSCTDVNFPLNKVKGDTAFSPKTKSPYHFFGYCEGYPPKNGPIFSQKSFTSKTPSTSRPGSLGELTQDASGQRAKMGESGIAYVSGRIRPLPLTTLPISYSRKRMIPAKNHPRKRMRQNSTITKTK
jgi:hypothetical protein